VEASEYIISEHSATGCYDTILLVFWTCTASEFIKTITFCKLVLFPSSDEENKKENILLGPLVVTLKPQPRGPNRVNFILNSIRLKAKQTS
jgi:hypothetical protein